MCIRERHRTVETRPNKRPLLSDLRESGSIEQDADLVIMLYSDNYYNNSESNTSDVEVILSKHRNGPTGTVKLKFDSNYAQFSNF